jgi:hypothetical protein
MRPLPLSPENDAVSTNTPRVGGVVEPPSRVKLELFKAAERWVIWAMRHQIRAGFRVRR